MTSNFSNTHRLYVFGGAIASATRLGPDHAASGTMLDRVVAWESIAAKSIAPEGVRGVTPAVRVQSNASMGSAVSDFDLSASLDDLRSADGPKL